MSDVTIRFEPSGLSVVVPHATTLLQAARIANLELDAPCNGSGTCGSCRVVAQGALSPMSERERELLGGAGVAAGKRLACRTRALGDVTVRLPEAEAGAQIVTSADDGELVVERPSERGIDVIGPLTGAAVDIGTTTVALALVDLRTGETLGAAGDLNVQRIHGADVMSRIGYATTGGGVDLQRLIVRQIESLAASALAEAGLETGTLAEIVLVGNTAMLGLTLGLDVSMLGEAPYLGAPIAAARLGAPAIGLDALPSADVIALPGIGPFVGADITAGLLVTGLAGVDRPTVLIDLGTNGEIVLASPAGLVATSTAAGPAFEGATIGCGMRATAGAIERVTRVGDTLVLGVIGEAAPAGMCGSGLIDLVAVLLDAGVLEADGRFADAAAGPLGERLTERDGVRVFVVDEAAGIVLTQKDVREVQLAVGAVRAGIELLLAEAGITVADVDAAIVAGGFGYHVRAESLARIGLIPGTWREKVRFAGNTALAGARMALVNSHARLAAEAIAREVRSLDLAAHPRFQEAFLGSLTFPE